MTSRGAAALVAAVAAAALLWIAIAATGAPRDERPPTRIGARGAEWSVVLSRTRVVPGPAVVEFQNAGEDPHDLMLRRKGAAKAKTFATGELRPGEVARLPRIWLKRGRYRLWCSLEGHAKLGMEATLRVKRKRR